MEEKLTPEELLKMVESGELTAFSMPLIALAARLTKLCAEKNLDITTANIENLDKPTQAAIAGIGLAMACLKENGIKPDEHTEKMMPLISLLIISADKAKLMNDLNDLEKEMDEPLDFDEIF